MRIVHLAAGAGAMYCGACARDVALARALIARGHEVAIVPLYTPLRLDGDEPLPVTEVHLGAINAYLQQLHPGFARLPRAVRRALDHPALLRWLSRFAVSTRPAQLGPMTVSVLAGPEGSQRAELDRLLDFLAQEPPDVLSITNSMLSGVAPVAKARLGMPILCEVKGEDGFIDALPGPHRAQALDHLRRNARAIDRFVAPSESYAARMAEYLDVPRARIAVVRSGIDARALRRAGPRVTRPFTVGYLSVITPRKGLHVLVEAMARLVAEGREVRLRAAGRVLSGRYARELRRSIRQAGLSACATLEGELPAPEKPAFLHSLSILVQPSILPEVLGTVALEAQAAGLPVVAPEEGCFPEMLALTEGGLLCAPRDPEALADALRALMDDPARADELGDRGAAAVAEHYAPDRIAGEMLRVLTELTTAPNCARGNGDGEEAL
ncbi:MAG: glycosyltransferase family 4 protein [Armatimonadota bacterium]